MRQALFMCSTIVALGCTADPVGRGLLVVSPHAEAAWMVRHPKESIRHEKTIRGADSDNDRAVRLALSGRYDDAERALPAPEAAEREVTQRAIRSNRDTIAYWRQRKAFAGSVAIPDPQVGVTSRAGTSSSTTPNASQQVSWISHSVHADAGGLRIRVPADVYWEDGETTSTLGDTTITAQGFLGRASEWPNTKLTGGLQVTWGTGPERYGQGETNVTPFVGVAHRVGFLAGTLVLGGYPTDDEVTGDSGAALSYAASVNFLVHPRFYPVVAARGLTYLGAGATGDTEVGLSPGLRFFLDPLDNWQLFASSEVRTARLSDGSSRSTSIMLSFSYRWF